MSGGILEQQQVSTGRILVIAANPDLGKSVAFALEAEGYEVILRAALPPPDEARGCDGVVLDHRAAREATREAVLEFCGRARSVVLLAGAPQPWLSGNVSAVVNTPHLGAQLTAAVNAAVGGRRVSAGR